MKLDDTVNEDIVDLKIFPQSIPKTASEIKYFYRYRFSFDYDYDIFLECKLGHKAYEAEKQRITSLHPGIQMVKSDTDDGFIDYRLKYTNIQIYKIYIAITTLFLYHFRTQIQP